MQRNTGPESNCKLAAASLTDVQGLLHFSTDCQACIVFNGLLTSLTDVQGLLLNSADCLVSYWNSVNLRSRITDKVKGLLAFVLFYERILSGLLSFLLEFFELTF